MLSKKERAELAKAMSSYSIGKTPKVGGKEFSKEAIEAQFVEELQELAKDSYSYEENKFEIFRLITIAVEEQLPKKINDMFKDFTKVTNYGENDEMELEIPYNNRARGKMFATKGTPAGHYEVFKVGGGERATVETMTAVGAIQIAFQDLITGRIQWADLVDIITEGIEDRIFDQVILNLERVEKSLPSNNRGKTTDFDDKTLNSLLGVVENYGSPVIFCTAAFAREITEGTDWASEEEKRNRRNVGYMTMYKGAKIVVLPNAHVDAKHEEKVLDDSKAYILPAGKGDIFHVGLKGQLQIRESQNQDWSKEMHMYQNFGTGAVVQGDIATYEITSLAK